MALLQAEAPEVGVRGVVPLTARELRLQRRVTLMFTVGPLIGVALAIRALWGRGIVGLDLGLLVGFYAATGFGITVGYHRLFTHRSFRAVRPVRVALAVLAGMAVQGSVLSWCATHRRHHAYSDRYGDPHSPHLARASGVRGVLLGLWHAHMGWLLDAERSETEEWVPDLHADPDMVRIDRAFARLTIATFALPPAIALVVTGSLGAALSAFLWGSLVRVFLLHHVTWSINSVCHFYGREAYRARDESRNVWPLAPLSFGESWHNNHHAFPWSARLGLRAWQIDPGWYVIRSLRAIRLVRDVKVPTRKQMADRGAG